GVKQCRCISHIIGFSGGNAAQYTTHYLAGSCFRQPFYNLNFIRFGNWTDNFGNQVVDFLLEGFRFGHPIITGHESADSFPFHIVWKPYNRCSYNFWMFVNGILNFSRSQSMPGDVEHVVNTSGDTIVPIFIAAAAVLCKIVAGIILKIGFFISFLISPYTTSHARPGVLNSEVPLYPV